MAEYAVVLVVITVAIVSTLTLLSPGIRHRLSSLIGQDGTATTLSQEIKKKDACS